MNYSMNEGRFLKGNPNNILYKKNMENMGVEIITNPNINIHTENNINHNSNPLSANVNNINKLLTSTNLKNRRIEIDLEKDMSNPKFNNSARDNIILLKSKQSTSQNNIMNKNKNNFNNINININISKKIISTYYNKSKNKKNIVVKKNSINSMNNSNSKKIENIKYNKINNTTTNRDNIYKNPSEVILRKYSNKNTNMKSNNMSQNKNKINYNSLYFSTNNYVPDKMNANNSNNKSTNNILYKRAQMNSNNNAINYFNNVKKNNVNIINNKIKDEKSAAYLSQIQIPMNVSFSPKNINSIQNYFKYLGAGQNKNKNNANSKNQKLSANNINNYIHNNTEYNLCNNTYTNTYTNTYNNVNSDYDENTYDIKNIIDFNKNDNNLDIHRNNVVNVANNNYINKNIDNNFSPNRNGYINKKTKIQKIKNSNYYENKDIDDFAFESPEELHYFFVNLFQKGKILNFDDIR